VAGRPRPLGADLLDGGKLTVPPLPHENLLTALGEVSAAFVGFSLVVGILSSTRSGTSSQDRSFFSTRDVAELGLLAIAASFLPLTIHAYSVAAESIWQMASAGLLLLWGLGLGSSVWRQRGILRKVSVARIALIFGCNLAGLGVLIANLFTRGGSSGGRYVTGVLLLLVLAGLQFVSATFDDSTE